MFNAVFCLGCDASEMDVLSCDVWMLVLFACWIGLPMKKFVPEPTRHGTPIRSCKISGLATWIFEIDVLGYLRIIKQGQSNCTQCHNQVFSFSVTVCPHKQPDPHIRLLYDFEASAKIWCGDARGKFSEKCTNLNGFKFSRLLGGMSV